jgi:hypothetical protein
MLKKLLLGIGYPIVFGLGFMIGYKSVAHFWGKYIVY